MRPVSPRRDVSCLLGTSNTYIMPQRATTGRCKVHMGLGIATDWSLCSDGIARVHGMSNVQAEELVE
jgi:hypothetical protein